MLSRTSTWLCGRACTPAVVLPVVRRVDGGAPPGDVQQIQYVVRDIPAVLWHGKQYSCLRWRRSTCRAAKQQPSDSSESSAAAAELEDVILIGGEDEEEEEDWEEYEDDDEWEDGFLDDDDNDGEDGASGVSLLTARLLRAAPLFGSRLCSIHRPCCLYPMPSREASSHLTSVPPFRCCCCCCCYWKVFCHLALRMMQAQLCSLAMWRGGMPRCVWPRLCWQLRRMPPCDCTASK